MPSPQEGLQSAFEIEDVTVSQIRPEAVRKHIKERSQQRRSLEDLQEQVYTLYSQFVPRLTSDDGHGSNAVSESPHSRVVLSGDLPHLLSEFEKQRMSPLVDDDSRAQLEDFCQQVPDKPVTCDDLIKMITSLQNAQAEEDHDEELPEQETDQHHSEPERDDDDNLTSSASSAASSSDAGHTNDKSQRARASTPPRLATTSSPKPFPHNNSSQAADFKEDVQAGLADDLQSGLRAPSRASDTAVQRSRTSSASAAQSRVTQDEQSKKRERHRSTVDAASKLGALDREILKGKGRAPPSSWSRPRPQALAARSRRTSSAASSSFGSEDGGTPDRENSSPVPNRQRQTSQPIAATPETDEFSFTGVPRSASSGYVFPRAMSPAVGDDTWYQEQEERWERGSDHRARSPSLRGHSPALDSPGPSGSYQAFSALSNLDPTSPRQGVPRSISHNADFWASNSAAAAANEELEAVQRRYDNLARVLQEKEKTFEGDRSHYETLIADLESKVETIQEDMHSLGKTSDDMKQRERKYLDEISRLEGDLALSQRRGDGLESARSVMHDDLLNRETTITTLQGKINDLQERVRSADVDEAEHFRREEDWNRDLDQYRQDLDDARQQLRQAFDRNAKMDVLESDCESLRAQLRDARSDLEEARRNSGFLPVRGLKSAPSSMSKRLGSELANVFGSGIGDLSGSMRPSHGPSEDLDRVGEVEDQEEVMRSADHSGGEEEADASSESVIITTTRRRRRHGDATAGDKTTVRDFVETCTQTDDVEDQGTCDDGTVEATSSGATVEALPPTYDEAAMEKAIIARLHPATQDKSTPEAVQSESRSTTTTTMAKRPKLEASSVMGGFSTLLGLSRLVSSPGGSLEDRTSDDERDGLSTHYQTLAAGVGMRCTVLEDALQRSDSEDVQEGPSSSKIRSRRHGSGTRRRMSIASQSLSRLASRLPGRNGDQQQDNAVMNNQALVCGLTLTVGLLLGAVMNSQSGQGGVHYHHHSGGILLEDSLAWKSSNTLSMYNYPGEYTREGPLDGIVSSLWRVFSNSARTIGGGGGGAGIGFGVGEYPI
ncbi:unnamed protein product [Sympodiomycopsis kandeliae]